MRGSSSAASPGKTLTSFAPTARGPRRRRHHAEERTAAADQGPSHRLLDLARRKLHSAPFIASISSSIEQGDYVRFVRSRDMGDIAVTLELKLGHDCRARRPAPGASGIRACAQAQPWATYRASSGQWPRRSMLPRTGSNPARGGPVAVGRINHQPGHVVQQQEGQQQPRQEKRG